MVKIDRLIEGGVWVFGALLLVLFVPKEKYREAWISFLFMSLPTWILGLFAVEYGLVEYPSRFMASVMKTSFTYEFFALPVISVLYNLYYPAGRSLCLKIGYMVMIPGILTGVEVVLEAYTDLIKYIHWNWLVTFLMVMLLLQISYWFYLWFVKGAGRSRLHGVNK